MRRITYVALTCVALGTCVASPARAQTYTHVGNGDVPDPLYREVHGLTLHDVSLTALLGIMVGFGFGLGAGIILGARRRCVALTRCVIATCVAALTCVASPAHAQTCTYVGTMMYCSNGLSSQQVGNMEYYNNGVTRQSVGPTDYYSAPYRPAPVYAPPALPTYQPPAIRR